MKQILILIVLSMYSLFAKDIPLPDGNYTFHHKFAEHPNMPSIKLNAKIEGNRIILINNDKKGVFPLGLIVDAPLYWHEKSKQWIILNFEEDKNALDVGGCSDGPEVIDLIRKIYWTC